MDSGGVTSMTTKTATYRWQTPQEWLADVSREWNAETLYAEFNNLAGAIDSDTLQDIYEYPLRDAGYFDKVPE